MFQINKVIFFIFFPPWMFLFIKPKQISLLFIKMYEEAAFTKA